MKITKYDLNLIFDKATQYYINDNKTNDLDDQQFKSKCFLKAVAIVINFQEELDFSELDRTYAGSIEEE